MHFYLLLWLYLLDAPSVNSTYAQVILLPEGLASAIYPWFFSLLFLVLLLASWECGFRLGGKSPVKTYDGTKKEISASTAAALGILGLLLAFSLVMAVSRFDARRLLVVDEANAIGSAYLRSQLVPPPEGPVLTGLLRQYLDAMLHYFDAGTDPDALRASREHTARLQKELWSLAAADVQKDPRSIPAGLLLQSLNQTFDMENARWEALTVRIPNAVLWVDALVGLIAMFLVGFDFGLAGHRHFLSTCLLALCIATVLAVIVDLDQPRQGLINVGEEPLLDLQHQMQER